MFKATGHPDRPLPPPRHARRPRHCPRNATGLPAVSQDAPLRVRRKGPGGGARSRAGGAAAAARRITQPRPHCRKRFIQLPTGAEHSGSARGRDGKPRLLSRSPRTTTATASCGSATRPRPELHRRFRRRPNGPGRAGSWRGSSTSVSSQSSSSRRDGRLLANEMAPRVHNSGTLDAGRCRREPVREPHPRRDGAPSGVPRMTGSAAMLNIIGELPDTVAVTAIRVRISTSTTRPRSRGGSSPRQHHGRGRGFGAGDRPAGPGAASR